MPHHCSGILEAAQPSSPCGKDALTYPILAISLAAQLNLPEILLPFPVVKRDIADVRILRTGSRAGLREMR
jgi:hypothetical protein